MAEAAGSANDSQELPRAGFRGFDPGVGGDAGTEDGGSLLRGGKEGGKEENGYGVE